MAYFLVHGRRYDVPEKLTLGEARQLKRIAGVTLGQIETLLAQNDPDALVAWLYVVMRRTDPKIELPDIEALDPSEIEYVDVEPAPEVDGTNLPTESSSAAAENGADGTLETTPGLSGAQLSDTFSG